MIGTAQAASICRDQVPAWEDQEFSFRIVVLATCE